MRGSNFVVRRRLLVVSFVAPRGQDEDVVTTQHGKAKQVGKNDGDAKRTPPALPFLTIISNFDVG